MTLMRRITISLPDELNAEIERLKKTDRYRKTPYSKIIRELIERGLKAERAKEASV